MTTATDYIIINDGQYVYPVLRSDLDRSGQTEESLRAMDGDEYSAWCSSGRVPVAEARCVGSAECIRRCQDLQEEGAETWYIG
jgi:hypothetical protein